MKVCSLLGLMGEAGIFSIQFVPDILLPVFFKGEKMSFSVSAITPAG